MNVDESNIQNPLKTLESSFYPQLKKPIKSFIYIIDKDTISKSYFDKEGNEQTKIDYESNKPYYKAVSKFIGNLKSENTFYVKDILQSTTTYKYDSNKNLIEWQGIKTVYDKNGSKPKLVDDIHWILEYDKNNKVTKKFSIDALKVKTLTYEYMYDSSNKLIEMNQLQWQDKYDYDNDLIIKKYRIFKNDNSVYSSSEYKYNEENLLSEADDKYYTTHYSYDASKLKKINYLNKKDNTIQEIDLIYSDDLLSKVEISTTDIYLKPEFYFITNYLYFTWNKNESNKLQMEFLYDKYNNIIEIKYFIKDDYKYSKFFIYSYY